MESSVIAAILLIYFVNSSLASDEVDQSLRDEHLEDTKEHKILLECQNSDYRTYIRCLKRQKRHHEHHNSEHTNETGKTKSCYEDCGMDLCTSTNCVHDCHTRCMKKTKETRIVQYETDCGDDNVDCRSMKGEISHTPNITTNIDVNNVIHNHMSNGFNNNGKDGKNTSDKNPYKPCTPDSNNPQGCNNNNNNNNNPYGSTGTGGFGLNIVPQIQLVPQLTFGLGLSPIGGCLSNMNWPCITQQPLNGGFDCSQCHNPFLRPKCETICWNQNTGNQ